ncbi:MAG: hypothetical protein JO353_04330 [Phycisphaerae bacterium]|nr:hypothetical protein [Phycisphaerae bacterium]
MTLADDRRDDRAELPPCVIYRVGKALSVHEAGRLLPEDTVVLPASSPLLSRYLPPKSPHDVYELAVTQARGAIHMRLLREVIQQWCGPEQCKAIEQLLSRELDHSSPMAVVNLLKLSGEHEGLKKRWNEMLADASTPLRSSSLKLVVDGRGDFLLVDQRQPENPIPWEMDDDDELLADASAGQYLLNHLQRVKRSADHLTQQARHMIEPSLGQVIVRAAELHDLGKADERMQTYLEGRRRLVDADRLLAKSRRTYIPSRERQLREWAELPKGFRHEMLSMQMASRDEQIDPATRDLLLHLLSSHHGFFRGLPPRVDDDNPPGVSLRIDDADWAIDSASRSIDADGKLAQEVANRFWRLVGQFGWWGIAYLELLVRAADQYASRELS